MVFDPILAPGLGLAGLLVAFVIYHVMSRHDFGADNVKRISDQIHLGAMVRACPPRMIHWLKS